MHVGGDGGDALLTLQSHPQMALSNSHSVFQQNLLHLYGDHVHHDGDGDFCPHVNHRHLNLQPLLLAQLSLQDVQLFLLPVLLETSELESTQISSLSHS
jgi:hypothetical protein